MDSRKIRERELHKRLAAEYDQCREGTPNGRYYAKRWLETMLSYAPKKKASLLDVGCGTGILYEVIKDNKMKFDYVGIDFSADMLKVGKKRYKGISLKVDDAEGLSFKDSSFDVVIMRSVLHHIPHPKKAVSEMVRVCKPGGVIIISEPRRNFITSIPRWLSKKFTKHFDKDHTHYTKKALKDIVESGGIREYEFKPFGYLAYPFGLTDLVPFAKYLPLPLLKALFAVDCFIAKLPLVKKLSWHSIVVGRPGK